MNCDAGTPARSVVVALNSSPEPADSVPLARVVSATVVLDEAFKLELVSLDDSEWLIVIASVVAENGQVGFGEGFLLQERESKLSIDSSRVYCDYIVRR